MRRATGVLVLAAVLVVAGGAAAGAVGAAPAPRDMAAYDWHNVSDVSIAQVRWRLGFLRAQGFKTVYLELGDYLEAADQPDGPERQARLDAVRSKLRRYVATATSLGLAVHALGGGPAWTGELSYLGRLLVRLVGEYNAAVAASERLQGVQLDIEPYGDRSFFVDQQASFAGYLDTLSGIVATYRPLPAQRANRGLQLGFAIPFWFDGGDGAPGPVLFNGATKPVAQHIIDMVGNLPGAYLVVMSYRNFTAGPDGSIAHVSSELWYARKVAAKCGLLVGQQYADVSPAYITFHGYSRREFGQAADAIIRAFARYPQFRGLSVDDLDSYRAARP